MAVPEMTYTVLGGTLNPTHSFTYSVSVISWLSRVALSSLILTVLTYLHSTNFTSVMHA